MGIFVTTMTHGYFAPSNANTFFPQNFISIFLFIDFLCWLKLNVIFTFVSIYNAANKILHSVDVDMYVIVNADEYVLSLKIKQKQHINREFQQQVFKWNSVRD